MSSDLDKFKELQAKNQKINEQAIKINTHIENAQQETKKILELLQQKYHISTIEECIELIEKREEENKQKLTVYENAVLTKEKEVLEKSLIIKNNS